MQVLLSLFHNNENEDDDDDDDDVVLDVDDNLNNDSNSCPLNDHKYRNADTSCHLLLLCQINHKMYIVYTPLTFIL